MNGVALGALFCVSQRYVYQGSTGTACNDQNERTPHFCLGRKRMGRNLHCAEHGIRLTTSVDAFDPSRCNGLTLIVTLSTHCPLHLNRVVNSRI